ncbi:MAG: hypothetical protein AB7F43_06100 [Bacteriovoracia bacterium]
MRTEQKLVFNTNEQIRYSPGLDAGRTYFDEYQKQGFILRSEIQDSSHAQQACSEFVENLDLDLVPHLTLFKDRIRLAKFDRIPSRHCQDAVDISNVSLHFDMGLPLLGLENSANIYVFTCLYFPYDQTPSPTKTRLFDLKGLFAERFDSKELEEAIYNYVRRYGDGWESFNSGRLACLGRLIEAAVSGNSLLHMKEHRIAEWFNRDEFGNLVRGMEKEEEFFSSNGISLSERETQVNLKPGDLLIIDNIRVAHGRIGKRSAEEIYQLMYGVENVARYEVEEIRKSVVDILLAQ